MSRTRMLVVGLVALLISLFVTFWIYRELRSRLAETVVRERRIVIATANIPLGSRLKAEQLRTIPWPENVKMDGVFEDPELLVSRGVIVPISANEPILESKLAPVGTAGLTAAIPEGMRAVAVKVNDVVGVAGFAVPGTRVDVVLSGSPDGNDYEVSKTFLENVQVLSAGQDVEIDRDGKPKSVQVITLLVSPEDAQRLALGSIDGQIRLALRNPLDLKMEDPPPVSKASLYKQAHAEAPPPPPAPRTVARAAAKLKSEPDAPPPPPKPRLFEVELIQGTQREVMEFEDKKPAQPPTQRDRQ